MVALFGECGEALRVLAEIARDLAGVRHDMAPLTAKPDGSRPAVIVPAAVVARSRGVMVYRRTPRSVGAEEALPLIAQRGNRTDRRGLRLAQRTVIAGNRHWSRQWMFPVPFGFDTIPVPMSKSGLCRQPADWMPLKSPIETRGAQVYLRGGKAGLPCRRPVRFREWSVKAAPGIYLPRRHLLQMRAGGNCKWAVVLFIDQQVS